MRLTKILVNWSNWSNYKTNKIDCFFYKWLQKLMFFRDFGTQPKLSLWFLLQGVFWSISLYTQEFIFMSEAICQTLSQGKKRASHFDFFLIDFVQSIEPNLFTTWLDKCVKTTLWQNRHHLKNESEGWRLFYTFWLPICAFFMTYNFTWGIWESKLWSRTFKCDLLMEFGIFF